MKLGTKIMFIGDPEAIARDAKKYGIDIPVPDPEKVYTYGGTHPKGCGGIKVDELPMPQEVAWQQYLWIKLSDALLTNHMAQTMMIHSLREQERTPISAPNMDERFTTDEDF